MNGCEYCGHAGTLRVSTDDPGVSENIYVCDKCWILLKDPTTALPLIRSYLTVSLRGSMPPEKLTEMINKYMKIISTWKPRQ